MDEDHHVLFVSFWWCIFNRISVIGVQVAYSNGSTPFTFPPPQFTRQFGETGVVHDAVLLVFLARLDPMPAYRLLRARP